MTTTVAGTGVDPVPRAGRAVPGAVAPAVTVLTDPDDSPACVSAVMACHALHRGVVVCLPQPGTVSRPQLGAALLVALGKSPTARPVQRPSRRSWELAGCWLAAEPVTDLVVLRADQLPAARWGDLAVLASATSTRLWLVETGAAAADGRAVVAAARGGRAPLVRPWRAGLAALAPDAATCRDDHDGFPAVPDVEFPQFRATARRLLSAAAFARIDAVYRGTFAQARTHAEGLRLSLLSNISRADLADAVLQQLTIEATSTDEVLTRVRAAQAGLLAEGLFLDVRPPARRAWGAATGWLEPRLDPSTVARLRGLWDPITAAAVVLTRATGLPAGRLCWLRPGALTAHRGGLHVRLSSMLSYRVPARAAGLVRAALARPSFLPPSNTSAPSNTDAGAGPARLFTRPDGAPLDDRALARLGHTGATNAGVVLPAASFRNTTVTDLHQLPQGGS